MHSALHFAIGLWLGMLLMLPPLMKAAKTGKRISSQIGRLILISYGIAIIAIIPNILRQAGSPESLCSSGFMNIFLFHPTFDKLISGGMLKGEAAILLAFMTQYGITMLAIMRAKRNAR